MNKKNYLLIKYVGEGEIMARVESGDKKLCFKKGDVEFAEESKAKHLTGSYNFEMVDPLDITPEALKKAQKRLEDKEKEKEKLRKEQEELKKVEAIKKEAEKEMREKLRELKDRKNSGKIDEEKYQAEKAKIIDKHSYKPEKATKKKEEKKEKEKKEEPTPDNE